MPAGRALYPYRDRMPTQGGYAMTRHRLQLVIATSVLLALPMLPGARADTGAKIVEEVDFATSCSPAVQQSFGVDPALVLVSRGAEGVTTAGTNGSSRCRNSQSRSRARLQ